jgi:hypothetical protein
MQGSLGENLKRKIKTDNKRATYDMGQKKVFAGLCHCDDRPV